MATPPKASNVTIPDDIRAKFSDLVELIVSSESMNDEERQYWINILPIMTPEQIQNLRDILQNERKQLQEIDKKYANTLNPAEQRELIAKTEESRRERRDERRSKESSNEKSEAQASEDLLKQIQSL